MAEYSTCNTGSQIKVIFAAEIFPLIIAHKIRMVELQVKKWGTEMFQTGQKPSFLTYGHNITHSF